jgi:hypothetical protein
VIADQIFMPILTSILIFVFCSINKHGFSRSTGFIGVMAGISIMTYDAWLPAWCYIIPILMSVVLYYMGRD